MKYRTAEIEALASIAKDVLENMIESMNDSGEVSGMVEHLQNQLGGDFDGLFKDLLASVSRRNDLAEIGIVELVVSADHVAPKWDLSSKLVRARSNSGGATWYVSIPHFGCSKDYATPEAAVRGLCLDNGCTNVRVKRTG